MFHEDIILFITSPPDLGWLQALKIGVIVFSLISLVIIFVLVFFKTSWLKIRFLLDIFEFFTYKPYGMKNLAKDFAKILARLETGLESEYKLAVIEADSLFDDVLKKMGYTGGSLGERLDKLTPAVLADIEQVREAHKIRNNIVHDPDYKLELQEAKNSLAIYEKALTELGAL